MFGIDLHIHTDVSPDGDLRVEEIFKRAKEARIACLSITDHNETAALLAAKNLAKAYDIKFIPGIEFNSNFNGRDVHILGYFIDYGSKEIEGIINEIKARKKEQAHARVKKLRELGFYIEYEDALRAARGMTPNGSIFLDALIGNEKNKDNTILKRYIEGDRSDSPHFNFYRDFFRYGKPAYVPLAHVETKKVIEVLLKTRALPVLAHPFDIPETEIRAIIKEGIVGIEAYSSYHTEEQKEYFLKMAKTHNLLVTAGSDFHGSHKPKVKMGIFIEEGERIIESLLKISQSGK